MNLLWISHNVPYPPKTGVLQRNYNLLREASRRADIHLLAVFRSDILPGDYDLAAATRELGKLCRQVEVVYLPTETSRTVLYWTAFKSLFTQDPFSVNWAKSRGMRSKLRKMVESVKFDVVHFDTIGLAGYRGEVGSLPKILNHHNMESHLLRRRVEFESHPLKRLYYTREAEKLERFQQRVCPEFDVHLTVSEVDRERLLELVPGIRTEVIANGVDVDYFRPSGAQQTPGNLVMASGMNWFPNKDAVLYMCDEIWPRLCARMPDLTWTVVGSSPPQRLRDLAAKDSRITVTGFVDDVRPYLDRAEIYLCPMRDGGGTRLKILDALSMSKPIVSTTMGCEGIDITPGVDVLLADTPDEFVDQVARLRSDAGLRQGITKAARELAIRRYSWDVIGNQLATVYRSLTAA